MTASLARSTTESRGETVQHVNPLAWFVQYQAVRLRPISMLPAGSGPGGIKDDEVVRSHASHIGRAHPNSRRWPACRL
jgi:hypothetical protein